MLLILEIPVNRERHRCPVCAVRAWLRYVTLRALRLGIRRTVDDASAKRFAEEYEALVIESDEAIERKVREREMSEDTTESQNLL